MICDKGFVCRMLTFQLSSFDRLLDEFVCIGWLIERSKMGVCTDVESLLCVL